ncbi:HAD family hydrolase [Streptomyces sp. NPDC101151]|uniref:HAD family hydrolase n=1 Tax=Streptomyces sp. NPDC101151 TaxID=3366115 RepID=UPI003825F59D
MTDARQILVLWDIDRTLLYVGDIDRQVYRETFTEIGGYSSDDEHRPAQAKYGTTAFSRSNTVIIGDSLEDVRTGLEGGAPVIGVASGKTTAAELSTAGADVVLDSLEDVPRLLDAIVKTTHDRN